MAVIPLRGNPAADLAWLTRAIDEAADRWGRLDILVNSAGVLAMGPLDQFTLEDFDRTIAVNVRSVRGRPGGGTMAPESTALITDSNVTPVRRPSR